MGSMFDAENPANLSAALDGTQALRISVLADKMGQAFDFEAGNAGPDAVAAAIADRFDAGKWSAAYVNESNIGTLAAALAAHGLEWTDARQWPNRGVYLWPADPSGNIAAGRWKLPVTPIAVQVGYHGTYDESKTADNFPAQVAGYIDGSQSEWPLSAWARFKPLPDGPTPGQTPTPGPGPAPAPTSPAEVAVNVQVLSAANPGPNDTNEQVRALQALLNMRNGANLATDGRYGPATAAAVVAWEKRRGIGVDAGIAGAQVWGTLLAG